jgi:fermentation-respiration switch protein FrsA (DUF1100 family)
MWTAVTGIIVLFVLIGALMVSVRVIEPQFAFFPAAGEDATPRDFGARFDALTIDTSDGEHLHAWSLPADNPRAYIVYFHGNGGNLSVWAPILVGLARRGYSLLAVDYRGYGRSTGRPSERGLYRDVDAVVGYAAAHRAAGVPLVYWGRSLGTAMAAHAATVKPPDRIVLESGFPDAATLMRSSPLLALLTRFSSYRFATAEMMQGVKAPVLVMHGDRDGIIPFGVGRALFDRLQGPKQFVIIRGGDHNDAVPPDAAAYWSAVDAFVARGGS